MSILTEITEEAFGLELCLLYATADNFTGRQIYGRAACFLHPDAMDPLRRAVDLAGRLGFTLRLYDAFRPSEAQWRLWEHTPDPTFVSDPRRGSPHSMGAAVDLTLLDRESGQPLEMGTGFDDLRPLSYHGNTEVAVEAQRNRALLLGLMSAAGWDFFMAEWWHYQLFKPRGRYPVLTDGAAGTNLMPPTPAPGSFGRSWG